MLALLPPRPRPSFPFLLPLTHSRPRPSLFFTPHRSSRSEATLAAAPTNSLGASATPIPGERKPETPPVVRPGLGAGAGMGVGKGQGLALGAGVAVGAGTGTGQGMTLGREEKPARRRVPIKSSKAAITITPEAVSRLRALLNAPTPTHLRIGVRQKGCAGMSYHLEYVSAPGAFDEVVQQDGVSVLIDSKALFSIIGSEMDWREDLLSSKFVFKNPNIVDACGCGESFNVGQSIQL